MISAVLQYIRGDELFYHPKSLVPLDRNHKVYLSSCFVATWKFLARDSFLFLFTAVSGFSSEIFYFKFSAASWDILRLFDSGVDLISPAVRVLSTLTPFKGLTLLLIVWSLRLEWELTFYLFIYLLHGSFLTTPELYHNMKSEFLRVPVLGFSSLAENSF